MSCTRCGKTGSVCACFSCRACHPGGNCPDASGRLFTSQAAPAGAVHITARAKGGIPTAVPDVRRVPFAIIASPVVRIPVAPVAVVGGGPFVVTIHHPVVPVAHIAIGFS